MKPRRPPMPPVPPLTYAAMARIERDVFTAMDRVAQTRTRAPMPLLPSAWRRRAAVALVAAAAAVALAVFGARAIRRGYGLPDRGARIATATSPSHLTLDGAAIDVAPSSALAFAAEHDGTMVLRLERGSVTCEVAARSARAPFVVEAGSTRVTVIGTRFTVTRTGDHAGVWVAHGTVEIGDEGLTQPVHAGERYRPGDGTRPGTVEASTAATGD